MGELKYFLLNQKSYPITNIEIKKLGAEKIGKNWGTVLR